MNINAEGLALIKSFEGLQRIAYQDVAGIWTIGYGHIKGVKQGMTITEEEAEKLLLKDLTDAERIVNRQFPVHLNENQYSALVSLAFNIGEDWILKSTVRRKLIAYVPDYPAAADAFLLFNRSTVNGKRVVVDGLTRRREAERALFLKPVAGAVA